MSQQLAIIAALPREIAALVRGVRPEAALRREGIFLYRLPGAVVVAAGMGAQRVTRAVEAAMAAGNVGTLVSAGLAGACTPELRPGQVVEATRVVDTATGERYGTAVADGVVLATAASIASVAEKRRLADAYGAAVVDMEAATVARLARAHGLSFRAIKAISDPHDFEIASLERFTGKRGEFRTAAFALHTALRPATWSQAATLGRNSTRALAALTERLRQVIATD